MQPSQTLKNVGLVRLLLASLVIIGHAPEQIDGSRARDPIGQFNPDLSLGHVSVLLFFLISGFLIFRSRERTTSTREYLFKRLLRIFPAFFVAYIIDIFLLAPFMGGSKIDLLHATANLITLHAPPQIPGLLSGLPYPALNGSMWTISYEFRCYILIAIFGHMGWLHLKKLIAIMTVSLLLAVVLGQLEYVRLAEARFDRAAHLEFWFGSISNTIDLTAAFMTGASFFVFREIFMRDHGIFWICASIFAGITLMFQPIFSDVSIITMGGFVVMWFSRHPDIGPLAQINSKWDISYGVYLYGWPISSFLLWHNRSIAPIDLAIDALLASIAAGTTSWFLVERPVKNILTRWASSYFRRQSALETGAA